MMIKFPDEDMEGACFALGDKFPSANSHQMIKLNRDTLSSFGPAVTRPTYDRDRLRPGIVHFGVGNFHRVHQGLAVETCLHHPGHEGWGICGVGLMDGLAAREKAEAYRRQDNLYTVTELTSATPHRTQIVGAMIEYLHAPSEPEAVLTRLADSATRIVALTITEGGYNIDEVSGAFRLDTPDIRCDLAAGRRGRCSAISLPRWHAVVGPGFRLSL
jgi:mannitol-1-phosphate/altronate dehydrogenase